MILPDKIVDMKSSHDEKYIMSIIQIMPDATGVMQICCLEVVKCWPRAKA